MDIIVLWINVFSKNANVTGTQSGDSPNSSAINNPFVARNKDEPLSKTDIEELRAAIRDDNVEQVQKLSAPLQSKDSSSRNRRQVCKELRAGYLIQTPKLTILNLRLATEYVVRECMQMHGSTLCGVSTWSRSQCSKPRRC